MKSLVRTFVLRCLAAVAVSGLALGALAVTNAEPAAAHGDGTELTDAGLAALRNCESGGNYGITGRFHGAYQYTQHTWNFATIEAGYADWSGIRPNQAPPEVQDDVTRWLWQADPVKFGGTHAWPVCHSRALEAMWAEPDERVLLLGDVAVLSARDHLRWWFDSTGTDLVIDAAPRAALCDWVPRMRELIAAHEPTRVVVASSLQPATSANGCTWDAEHWGTEAWRDGVVADARGITSQALDLGVDHVHWLDSHAYPSMDPDGGDDGRNEIVESLERRVRAEVTGLTPVVAMDEFLGETAVEEAPRLYSWEEPAPVLRDGQTFDEQLVGTEVLWARFGANLASYVYWTGGGR